MNNLGRAMCGRLRVGKENLSVAKPCARPVDAVRMAAGQNALRGSDLGQQPAFGNAVARMGCPDRRIDRLCTTCCSPFPTCTSCQYAGTTSFAPRVRRVPCSAAFGHHASAILALDGERNGRDLCWSPRQQPGRCLVPWILAREDSDRLSIVSIDQLIEIMHRSVDNGGYINLS
jgi:hypothetical protein